MDFSSSSRYSVADVLEFLETSEDDLIDDEPIMEGSDDFEDLAVENTSENLEDSQQDAYTISPMHIPNSLVQPPPNNSLPQTPIPSAQTSTPPSTQTSTVWSTNLHPVVIYPFTGTVGATFTVMNVPLIYLAIFFLQKICFI